MSMRRRFDIPILLVSTAINLEQHAGSSHLPDVEADLTYAARLLRERAGQCDQVIVSTQPGVVDRARTRGVEAPSGRVVRRPGWAAVEVSA